MLILTVMYYIAIQCCLSCGCLRNFATIQLHSPTAEQTSKKKQNEKELKRRRVKYGPSIPLD